MSCGIELKRDPFERPEMRPGKIRADNCVMLLLLANVRPYVRPYLQLAVKMHVRNPSDL